MTARTRRHDERLRTRYGPWALVTGASSGIGRQMALELARAGVHVVLVGRRQAALDALALQLQEAHGTQSKVVRVDLSDELGVQKVLDRVADLDLGLVVAAAGFGTSGPFTGGTRDDELAMLDVNCRAVLLLCLGVTPQLVSRGRGGLILLSSIVAFQGTPGSAHYAATKAYVQTLAEGLHSELRGSGVDVLSSAPGPVDTAFADRADLRPGRAADPQAVAVTTLRALGRRTTVAPGAMSKLLTWSLALLPRWGRIRVMGAVMGGMTRHQQPQPESNPQSTSRTSR